MNIPRRDWIYNSFWKLQILDRGGNALQSSQNADCDHRQSQGADQERNGHKYQTIFRGVCNQHGNAQQCNDAACQMKQDAGAGDQTNKNPCEQIDCQDNGTEQNFDNQFHVYHALIGNTVLRRFFFLIRPVCSCDGCFDLLPFGAGQPLLGGQCGEPPYRVGAAAVTRRRNCWSGKDGASDG